jgi:hypothetical protein
MYAFGDTKVFAYCVASSAVYEELSVADVRLAYTTDPESTASNDSVLNAADFTEEGRFVLCNEQSNGDLPMFDSTRAQAPLAVSDGQDSTEGWTVVDSKAKRRNGS